mmetsp:Transcript_24412/g.35013  ORF Transcript_24412/g.35013 Transcript_24412/m.35013 type:complete len:200 (+) Transcript_24412:21-620(+)
MVHFFFLKSCSVLMILSLTIFGYLTGAQNINTTKYNQCDSDSVVLLYSDYTLLDASSNFSAYTVSLCNETIANSICAMQQQQVSPDRREVNLTADFSLLYKNDTGFMDYAVACRRSGGKFCVMSMGGIINNATSYDTESLLDLGLNVIGYPSCFSTSCNNNEEIEELMKIYTVNFLRSAVSVHVEFSNQTNLTTELYCD